MNRIIICPSYDHVAHLCFPVPAHRRSHVAAACGLAPHHSGAERECSRQRAPTALPSVAHGHLGRCLKLLLTRGGIRTRIDRRGRRDGRGVSSYGFPGWTSEINRTARVLRRGSTAGHADRQFFGGKASLNPAPRASQVLSRPEALSAGLPEKVSPGRVVCVRR